MGTLIQDLKYGLRMLAKSPGFTAVAVLTLALGIGANTAIFSVVNGVLLNPLPYDHPEQLVALYSRTSDFEQSSISYPNFLDWVRDNHTFSALAAYRGEDFSLTGIGEPERLPGEMVSASFFPLLGVNPVIGRTFRPEEDQVGAGPVVLISGGLWKRKFGSSPDVLGKQLTLDGVGYTVVGVIPASFHYYGWNFRASDLYVPIGQWNDPTFRDRRVGMGMDAVGRLKPGVTFEQANADMQGVARRLAEAYPDVNKGTGVTLVPLKHNMVGDVQPFLLMLLAAVGFVLLIACVNVANLMLARSTSRFREFAIRTALGAGRARVIRQLLTESTLLALAGGGLGLLVAFWGVQGILHAIPETPRADGIRLDAHVLWFTLGASVLAGILFGLVPAFKSAQPDCYETLKEGGRGPSATRHRAQSVFVVVEMALALVLLAGAGLMIRSLARLWSVNPGFDPRNVIYFRMSFPIGGLSPDAIRAALREMGERLEAIPGVQAASLSQGSMPMRGDSEVPFYLEGQPKPLSQNDMKSTLFYLVQPDYLKVMKTPLLRGRFLTRDDNLHSPLVTVIDDRFARMAFGDQDPIGKRINLDILNVTAEVVGVVGHVKQWGLDTDATTSVQAQCYLAIDQFPDQYMPLLSHSVGVVVRTGGSPLAQFGAIRRTLQQFNSQLVIYETETMDGIISDSMVARHFAMILLGVFSALALVLSCVGIYGVISYVTGQRAHEIGIRMALGAKQSDVLRMVLAQAAEMTLLGVLIGVAAAIGLARLIARLLFGVSAHDPLTFLAAAGLLVLVALAACYIPARRATKVDPMTALRYE